MKNLYSKKEFLSIIESNKNNNDEMISEGLFQFLGKMFNKAATYIKNIKGGKEVQNIYDKYIKLMDEEFKRSVKIDLNLTTDEQLKDEKNKETGNQKSNQNEQGNTSESVRVLIKNKLNEADEADIINASEEDNKQVDNTDDNLKLTVDTIKKKQNIIQKILNVYQNKALREMDNVLRKFGGRNDNPKLATIIDNKKDEFKLALLNAEITALEQGGDKNTAQKIAIERNKLVKDLDLRWKNIDKVTTVDIDVKISGQDVKLTVGKPYRYKKDDGTIGSVEIIDKSDKDGTVKASYRSGESAGKEHYFRLDNIEYDWKPEIGNEYKYYSKDAGKEVTVKVDKYDDNTKLADVYIGDSTDKKFKVYSGALIDL